MRYIISILTIIYIFSISTAEARVAFPHRNDVGEIEAPTIALQAQLQLFEKYVLNGLDNIKSITNLENLADNINVIKEAETSAACIKNNIASIETDNLVSNALSKIDSVFSNAGKSPENGFEAVWSSIFGTNNGSDGESVEEIIENGGGGRDALELAGEKGTLKQIRQQNGLAQTAATAAYRTSQAAKLLADQAASSLDEYNSTVINGAGYIYSVLPMIKPELLESHSGDISGVIGTYTPQDVNAYFVFLSDAAMMAPTAEIGVLLDKYFNKDSAYSDTKLLVKQNSTISSIDDFPNKAGYLNEASAETAAAGMMGNLVKEQAVALNQWEAITEICADTVKLDALKAGMQSASMSLALLDFSDDVIKISNMRNLSEDHIYD